MPKQGLPTFPLENLPPKAPEPLTKEEVFSATELKAISGFTEALESARNQKGGLGYTLAAHQASAVATALVKPKFAFFHQTGTGKTCVGINIIQQRKYPKTLVICPLSIIELAWIEDLTKFAPEIKPVNLWSLRKKIRNKGGRKKWEAAMNAPDGVYLINFEAVLHCWKDLFAGGFEMLIVDECFPGDTSVDTVKGIRKIRDIKPGDRLINASGIDTVKRSLKRFKADCSLSLTTIQGQDIISSTDHPFFTQRGWVRAKDLKKGKDYVVYTSAALSVVREALDPEAGLHAPTEPEKETEQKTFLRKILLSEMEDVPAGDKGLSSAAGKKQKDKRKVKKVFSERVPVSPKAVRADSQSATNEQPGDPRPGIKGPARNEAQAPGSGGQWKADPHTPTKTISTSQGAVPEPCVEAGSCHFAGEATEGVPDQLQGGHCKHGPDDLFRGRRLQSLLAGSAGPGREKGKKTGGARVENTSLYKSSSPIFDRYRDERGRIVLYDLEMTNHPSFSVSGLLVHNSSKAKAIKSKITKTLILFSDKVRFLYLFSGTPAPNDKLEYWTQVRLISKVWGTRFYSWRSLFCYSFGYGGYTWDVKKEMYPKFLRDLASCSEVVKKLDVLDLPPITENNREVFLSPKEMRAYKEMERDLIVECDDMESIAANAAVKMMKLREASSGFLLGEEGALIVTGNSKLKALTELIEEIGNHPIIIWTQFHYEAAEITKALAKAGLTWGRVDGTVANQNARIAAVKQFKKGNIQVLVAHPASLGHGVTLTNCNYAIYYSLSYSYEMHQQSMDRIFRRGQTKSCSYYYMLANGTVDSVILKALRGKGKVVNEVFDYLKGKRR